MISYNFAYTVYISLTQLHSMVVNARHKDNDLKYSLNSIEQAEKIFLTIREHLSSKKKYKHYNFNKTRFISLGIIILLYSKLAIIPNDFFCGLLLADIKLKTSCLKWDCF